MATDKKIHTVLIGAGNLATRLGKALVKGGYAVDMVYSRTEASARTLAEALHTAWTTSPEAIQKEADFYIFSVKDDALESLAKTIAPGREGIFLHTAGSMPMDVFKGYASRYGVAYPMQTFSKDLDVDFSKIPCFIEASDYRTFLETVGLFGSICGSIQRLDSEKRRYLHLAAVFACNFTNHCYALAEKILAAQGLPFRLMQPLIEETAHKAALMSPKAAQTGPAVRYDENVIRKQEDLLKDDSATRRLYELMSESIHRLATTNEPQPSDHDKL